MGGKHTYGEHKYRSADSERRGGGGDGGTGVPANSISQCHRHAGLLRRSGLLLASCWCSQQKIITPVSARWGGGRGGAPSEALPRPDSCCHRKEVEEDAKHAAAAANARQAARERASCQLSAASSAHSSERLPSCYLQIACKVLRSALPPPEWHYCGVIERI